MPEQPAASPTPHRFGLDPGPGIGAMSAARSGEEETLGHAGTAHFEARLDRLLVYRSCSLHSGIAPFDSPLSADRLLGRLTLNILVDFDPD